MNYFRKSQIIIPLSLSLFFLATPAFAAAPDGLGPWADTVVSTNQGMMKNGLAVPAIRSNPDSALGVAENDTVDGHFYSLGFGGTIVLGFDNGISSGVFVVEATNDAPNYPIEKAKIEVSQDGTTWVMAGNVNQDGQVNVPETIDCAKFVRITDISDPAIMPDAIADGYDVDGVQATGDACTPGPTATPPSPTAIPTAVPTIAPTQVPSNPGGPGDGLSDGRSDGRSSDPQATANPNTATTTTTANTTNPGFPNAGTVRCSTNPLVPCFPNTGSLIPGLPNTGIGPDNTLNMSLLVVAGIFTGVVSFYLIRRKYKFSSKR